MKQQLFKKNILIFGGSFDPIHYGHISMLQAAINTIYPDLTIVVPNFISPHKNKFFITMNQKLDLLNLAFEGWKNLVIEDYELKKQNTSYFIDTLNYLIRKYPNSNFSILIGSDQYYNFSNWKEYKEIINNVNKVLVYPRKIRGLKNNNCFLRFKYLSKFKFLKYDPINISSTEIRDSYLDFTYLPKNIIDYINKHGLYGAHRVEIRNTHKRYEHCLRVAYMSSELAKIYDESLVEKAYVAGLYHDIAKDMIESEQERIAKEILNIKDYVSWKVLHPYIGEYILKNDFVFEDKEILQAIARHTLPFIYYDSEPSLLDKIIYVADKLEPNRTDADVFLNPIQYYRDLAKTDINKCFIELYNDLQSGLNV